MNDSVRSLKNPKAKHVIYVHGKSENDDHIKKKVVDHIFPHYVGLRIPLNVNDNNTGKIADNFFIRLKCLSIF